MQKHDSRFKDSSSGVPRQVLEVVRSNYDTLTLKLQDGLDQFERYSEQPKEVAFFKELVRDADDPWLKSLHNPFQFSISNVSKE